MSVRTFLTNYGEHLIVHIRLQCPFKDWLLKYEHSHLNPFLFTVKQLPFQIQSNIFNSAVQTLTAEVRQPKVTEVSLFQFAEAPLFT